jgi:tRNA nucleotidyltransferase/poly(A) polymerase
METNTLISIGISLLKDIKSLGYKAYIVGGTPRDIMLGEELNDIDIATNCPIEILEESFHTHNIGQSKNFGILSILYKGKSFEVAQFRADGKYFDGRRPDSIEMVNNFKDDVARRDFTINSLAMDSEGEIIDYFSGKDDIVNKIVRTVGDPYERFQEDYLRMLRAARFASADQFIIEKKTRQAIRKLFRLINRIAPERIREELIKSANKSGPQFAKYILILDDLKLLNQILPEVAATKYFRQDLIHHPEGPTVFDHIIACLKVMTDEPYQSKLSALFHDVGKCISFQDDVYGWKTTYYRHEMASEILTEDICDSLKFSTSDKEAMLFAAKNHMKIHKVLKMKPSKVARLTNHIHINTLLDVARADVFSRGEKFMYRDEFNKITKKMYDIKDKWEKHVSNHILKLVDGKHIMEVTGLKPSRSVGIIKKEVENKIIDEQLDPNDIELIDKIILEELKKLTL